MFRPQSLFWRLPSRFILVSVVEKMNILLGQKKHDASSLVRKATVLPEVRNIALYEIMHALNW
jgi:hypothetical protein